MFDHERTVVCVPSADELTRHLSGDSEKGRLRDVPAHTPRFEVASAVCGGEDGLSDDLVVLRAQSSAVGVQDQNSPCVSCDHVVRAPFVSTMGIPI